MTFPKVLQKELDKPLKFFYIIIFIFSIIFTFDLIYYGIYIIAFTFIIFVLDSANSGFKEFYIPDLFTWFFVLVWGIFEISQSFVKSDALYYFNTIVLIPFFIFIIFNNSKLNIKDLDLFFKILFVSGVILSFFSFAKLIEINYNFKYRITSTWDHYNLVAAFYMILLMFNLSFIVNSGKSKRIVYYISFVLILMGMFMTQTRGIWLATLISVFYYVFRKPKLIVPIFISLTVLIFLFYGIIIDRVLSAVNFGSDVSSLGRFQAWYASILLIKNNFLLGYGFDSFRYLKDSVITAYFVILPHSHNTYLTLILDLGFIGFIFYISFFVKAFFYSFKIRKKIDNPELIKYVDGLQLSFVGLIIAFIFEPYFTVLGSINYMVWILISLSYYIRYNYREGLFHS